MTEKKMNDATNKRILQSSTNLHEVDNVIHRVEPVRRHRTCQTIQTIQLLQLTKRSEHQDVDKTGLRVSTDKHGIGIVVRFIRLVCIINGLCNLNSHDSNGMVGRGRVGNTQTSRPFNESMVPFARAVLLRQSRAVGSKETSHHATRGVEGTQRVIHEAIETSAS